MLALDFYKELFEPKFLEVTKAFFKEAAAQNFSQLNVSHKIANLNFNSAAIKLHDLRR